MSCKSLCALFTIVSCSLIRLRLVLRHPVSLPTLLGRWSPTFLSLSLSPFIVSVTEDCDERTRDKDLRRLLFQTGGVGCCVRVVTDVGQTDSSIIRHSIGGRDLQLVSALVVICDYSLDSTS